MRLSGFLACLAIAAAVAPTHAIHCASSGNTHSEDGRKQLVQDARTCFLEMLVDPSPLKLGTDSSVVRPPYTPATMPYHGPYHGLKHGGFAGAFMRGDLESGVESEADPTRFVDAMAATMGGFFHDMGMGAVMSAGHMLSGGSGVASTAGQRVSAALGAEGAAPTPSSAAPAPSASEPDACVRLHNTVLHGLSDEATLAKDVVECVSGTTGVVLDGNSGAAVGADRGQKPVLPFQECEPCHCPAPDGAEPGSLPCLKLAFEDGCSFAEPTAPLKFSDGHEMLSMESALLNVATIPDTSPLAALKSARALLGMSTTISCTLFTFYQVLFAPAEKKAKLSADFEAMKLARSVAAAALWYPVNPEAHSLDASTCNVVGGAVLNPDFSVSVGKAASFWLGVAQCMINTPAARAQPPPTVQGSASGTGSGATAGTGSGTGSGMGSGAAPVHAAAPSGPHDLLHSFCAAGHDADFNHFFGDNFQCMMIDLAAEFRAYQGFNPPVNSIGKTPLQYMTEFVDKQEGFMTAVTTQHMNTKPDDFAFLRRGLESNLEAVRAAQAKLKEVAEGRVPAPAPGGGMKAVADLLVGDACAWDATHLYYVPTSAADPAESYMHPKLPTHGLAAVNTNTGSCPTSTANTEAPEDEPSSLRASQQAQSEGATSEASQGSDVQRSSSSMQTLQPQ